MGTFGLWADKRGRGGTPSLSMIKDVYVVISIIEQGLSDCIGILSMSIVTVTVVSMRRRKERVNLLWSFPS